MIRALIILCLLSLAACAQLKSTSGGGGGGPAPGERNDVGKASSPNASGFLDMPFLTGLSEEEARATLAESQMTGEVRVEYVECNDKNIPEGHVCNQVPIGGETTTTTSPSTLFLVKNP